MTALPSLPPPPPQVFGPPLKGCCAECGTPYPPRLHPVAWQCQSCGQWIEAPPFPTMAKIIGVELAPLPGGGIPLAGPGPVM